MERHRPDEIDVFRVRPGPDWAGAFAGAFGTVQNLIEADVFCSELD